MTHGPWRCLMPLSRCAVAFPNASRRQRHVNKRPAKLRFLMQISQKTLKRSSATASRGTRQRGNSPRLKRHYRRRTQRPYCTRNSRTGESRSRRSRNRPVGGNRRRVGSWSLPHQNSSAAATTAGVHRAALERRAGTSGDTRNRAAGRAHRRPTGSDGHPACVRGPSDRRHSPVSRLRSRDVEHSRFPKNPRPYRRPILKGWFDPNQSGQWDSRFLGNDAQLFHYRQNQRYAFFAPHLFRFAFGIAGNERTIGSRRGLRGAKSPDVIIHLALEFVRIDKSVDAHGAKKVPDSLPHTARRNFLAQRKRRRKWTPVRAAQHVDHDRQPVSFMSAAFAIRAQRQKRAACDDVVGIGGAAPRAVDAPTFRNRLAAAARHFNFSIRGGTRSHIEDDGRLLSRGKSDRDGI